MKLKWHIAEQIFPWRKKREQINEVLQLTYSIHRDAFMRIERTVYLEANRKDD